MHQFMKNSLLYDKVFGLDINLVHSNLAHPSNRMRYDDASFIAQGARQTLIITRI